MSTAHLRTILGIVFGIAVGLIATGYLHAQEVTIIDPPATDDKVIRATVAESTAVIISATLSSVSPLARLRPADPEIALRKGDVAAGDMVVSLRQSDEAPGRLFDLTLQLPATLSAGSYRSLLPLVVGPDDAVELNLSLRVEIAVEAKPSVKIENSGETLRIVGRRAKPVTLFLRGIELEDLAIITVALATDRGVQLSSNNLELLESCPSDGVEAGTETRTGPVVNPGSETVERIVMACVRTRDITYAGTYSGTIRIGARSSAPPYVAIPTEVVVRGPAVASFSLLPVLLTVVVLVLGLFLSLAIPKLTAREESLRLGARALALLPLIEKIRGIAEEVLADPTLGPAVRDKLTGRQLQLDARVADLQREVIATRKDPLGVGQDSVERWEALTRRFATIAELGIERVFEQWEKAATGDPPDPFAEAIKKLDDYALGVGPDTDESELVDEVSTRRIVAPPVAAQALNAARAKQDTADPVQLADVPAPKELLKDASRARRRRLILAYAVVGVLAIYVFVYNDQAFGTFGDYLKVFTWAFGLSETADRLLPGKTPAQLLTDVGAS